MVKKICNILILLILAAALVVLGILVVPLFMGRQLYAVQTGSMAPTYPVGSIVVVEPTAGSQVVKGDVITFQMPGFTTPVTHRVIERDSANQTLRTKGDNNENADFSPVPFANVEGRVVYGIPLLGSAVLALHTPVGWLVLGWAVFFIVLLLISPSLLSRRKGKRINLDRYPALQRQLLERRQRQQGDSLYASDKSVHRPPYFTRPPYR